jgi:hypothetical protein
VRAGGGGPIPYIPVLGADQVVDSRANEGPVWNAILRKLRSVAVVESRNE